MHESLEPPDDEAVISDLISEASCRAQLEQHEEAKEVRTRDDARAPYDGLLISIIRTYPYYRTYP